MAGRRQHPSCRVPGSGGRLGGGSALRRVGIVQHVLPVVVAGYVARRRARPRRAAAAQRVPHAIKLLPGGGRAGDDVRAYCQYPLITQRRKESKTETLLVIAHHTGASLMLSSCYLHSETQKCMWCWSVLSDLKRD